MVGFCFMEIAKNAVGSLASYCKDQKVPRRMSEILHDFLEYARYELNFSPQTIRKYEQSLNYFVRDIGDKPVEQYEVQEFVHLKKVMMERGNCETTIAGVVYAVRSFMLYCKNFLGLKVLQAKQIRPPKRFRREVIFLTKEEIEAFISTINLKNWADFRFRVLVEVLLGTGMRIGEVLSLNRKDIDWERSWLDPLIYPKETSQYLLPYMGSDLEMYPISTLVNGPKNDMAEILKPVYSSSP